MQWTKASAGALYSAFGEADLLRRTRACLKGQRWGGQGSQSRAYTVVDEGAG